MLSTFTIANIKQLVPVTLLLAAVVFLGSNDLFSKAPERLHGTGTHMTLFFMKSWEMYGGMDTLFSYRAVPKDDIIIDYSTVRNHGQYYATFPPGTALFPYVIFKALHLEINFKNLYIFSYIVKILSAFLVALIVYLLITARPLFRYASSVMAAYIFLSNTLLYKLYAINYFHSTAIIFPLLLVIFCEIHRDKYGYTLEIDFIQSSSFMLCMLTDWLTIPVILVMTAKRIIFDKRGSRNLVLPWISIICALLFFVLQIWHQNTFAYFFHKILARTGLEKVREFSLIENYPRYLTNAFSSIGTQLLALGLVASCLLCIFYAHKYHKNRHANSGDPYFVQPLLILKLILIITVPLILHTIILRQHSSLHHFSPYFFIIFFSTCVFFLLPNAFSTLYRLPVLVSHTLLVIGLVSAFIYVDYDQSFRRNNMNNLTTSKTEHDSIDKRISILSEIYALFPSDSIFYSPNMPMHSWDGSTYEQREVILQKMSVIFPFKNIDDLIEHQQALGGTERHIHRIIYPTDIELSYRDTCDFANSIFRDILVNTPNVSLIQKDDFEVISFGNTLFQDKGVLQKLKNKDVCT